MPTHLNKIESLLYRLITAPSGVAEGLAAERDLGAGGLDAVVLGDDRLSAEARVDIYANMYFYRILDALKEDFPATLAVLGADNFHNLVTGYMLEYPPTDPSISHCGRHLADYLRDHPMRESAPFIADLARLERAIVEVFQAPDAAALNPDSLRAIAPEEWPALKLAIHPSAQILALGWRVSELLRAVEEHREWKASGAGRSQSPRLAERCARLLSRSRKSGSGRSRSDLARRDVRGNLRGRRGACRADQDPVAAMNRMLARWLSDSLLALG